MFLQPFLSFCKDILAYLLHLTPASDELDLRAASAIALIRACSRGLKPGRLSAAQQDSLQPREADEQYLTLRCSLAISSDNNVSEVIGQVVQSLGENGECKARNQQQPSCEDLRGAWVGPCLLSAVDTPFASMSEKAQYGTLMGTVKRSTTILYFHGGQFWRRGRAGIKLQHELASGVQGRTFGLLYRLSPQKPFPAALTDCLAAYLCLLYPSSDHLHEPVDPRDIYLAGDSAGGNLVVALLKLILAIRQLRHDGKTGNLWWNGQERDIPLPAGAAVLSPYLDMTRSFQSEVINLPFDIIPARGPPFADHDRCDIWPAKPPRHHVYASDDALLHPLVSPVTVEDWTGCPSIWICLGEECLADAGLYMAHKMASANVQVFIEQFSAQPHNFALLYESDATAQAIRNWAGFICNARDGSLGKSGLVKWSHQQSRLSPHHLTLDAWHDLPTDTVKKQMRTEMVKWGMPPC